MEKQIRYCDVCGVSSETKKITYNSVAGMCLCSKHFQQFLRFGKFMDQNKQTVYDPNEIRVYEDHAEIDCYDHYGNVDYTYMIDVEDVELAKKYKWRTTLKRGKPYLVTGNNKKVPITYFARVVTNAPKGIEVDHIDGDSRNNQKHNLRFADRTIQTCNLAPRFTNKIGVRGVAYDKRNNKYVVDFACMKNRYFLKPFTTVEEAVYARYLLETKLNPYRYTSNDEFIMTFIDKLSNEQKIDIDAYIDMKIREKEIS